MLKQTSDNEAMVVSDDLEADSLVARMLSSATYLVAEIYLMGRPAAVLAFLIPMAPSHCAPMRVSGTQPGCRARSRDPERTCPVSSSASTLFQRFRNPRPAASQET